MSDALDRVPHDTIYFLWFSLRLSPFCGGWSLLCIHVCVTITSYSRSYLIQCCHFKLPRGFPPENWWYYIFMHFFLNLLLEKVWHEPLSLSSAWRCAKLWLKSKMCFTKVIFETFISEPLCLIILNRWMAAMIKYNTKRTYIHLNSCCFGD